MTNSLEPSAFAPEPLTPRTTWHWRLENTAGAEVSSTVAGYSGFPSQSDAESWLGEYWRELADDGVEAATLFEGDREVYGPMSLHV